VSDNSKGNYIRNTTTDRVAQMSVLVGGFDGPSGAGRAIEAMEASGQRELVESSVLPVEGPIEDMEKLGFVFGDVVQGDSLFRHAQLPEGWTKVGTDHSMHSKIVDERGVERVSIFYKAAFYDRRASMHLVNLGYSFQTHILYGDDTDAEIAKVPWDVLTADERASVIHALREFLRVHRDEEENPGIREIYADRFPRAEKAIAHFEALS
jgi:hypothetical protein